MLSRRAIIAAASAYTAWGFFALYWKLVQHYPSLGIICHRVIWACVFYGAVWFAMERKPGQAIWPDRRNFLLCVASGIMISANWLVFIYSVNSNQLLEGSLAYFINPLLNIFIGALIFGEKMSLLPKLAFTVAATGCVVMALRGDHFPWLALAMAGTFSIYGALKKVTRMNVFHGNWLETLLVSPIALAGAVYFYRSGIVVPSAFDWLIFVCGGLITGFPMIWFALGARDLPYSLMGFLQFLSPTLQFIIAIYLYGEVFTEAHGWGFSFIWAGVGLYVWSLFRKR